MTDEQKEFVDQSVRELAMEDEDGRIAPVRLSLFAQMLSEKEWTPLTLQNVGGAKGVGVRFLEETFDTDRGRIRFTSVIATYDRAVCSCKHSCLISAWASREEGRASLSFLNHLAWREPRIVSVG